MGRIEDDITDEEWLSDSLRSIFHIDGVPADVRNELVAVIESITDFQTCSRGTLDMFYAAARSVFEGNKVALGALTELENPETRI